MEAPMTYNHTTLLLRGEVGSLIPLGLQSTMGESELHNETTANFIGFLVQPWIFYLTCSGNTKECDIGNRLTNT